MSKLIKPPIIIPKNVKIIIKKNKIFIKGKLGINKIFVKKFFINIDIIFKNNNLLISYKKNTYLKKDKFYKSSGGTIYSLLKNSILGVSKGFSKKILLVGLGYKVIHYDNINRLDFFLGYSHPIKYKYPKTIKIECLNSNEIIIKGINKQLVGQIASIIYSFRKPDIYKGKGIKYENQIINLKLIKKK